MKVIVNDARRIVVSEPALAFDCRLVVCTDYRCFDFSRLSNLFLYKIGKINEFSVFCRFWERRSAKQSLDFAEKILKPYIEILEAYPNVDILTTIIASKKGLFIDLPNRYYLNKYNASDLVDALLRAFRGET